MVCRGDAGGDGKLKMESFSGGRGDCDGSVVVLCHYSGVREERR